MAIQVRCGCGLEFAVPDQMAGRRARCKTCGNVLQIPLSQSAPIAATPVAPSKPVVARAIPVAPASPTPSAPQPAAPVTAPVAPQPLPPPPARPEAEKALAHFNQETQSQASNPGKLLVNPLLHLRAYPGALLMGAACLIISGLLMLLYPPFFLLVLGSLWFCWKMWFPIRFHFVGGCINPGMVVCLDPPLVAVATNLGRANDREEGTPVIVIRKQPLNYMLDGMPQVGQRVSTVLTYVQGEPSDPHWEDCVPKLPACVTRDRGELDRIYRSISQKDWQELDLGLRQIPPPLEDRFYRIFPTDMPPPTDAWLAAHLETLVQEILSHVPSENQYLTACGIPADIMQKAQEEVAKGISPSEILAICATSHFVSGFIATRRGFLLDFVRGERTSFRWQDVRGALFCNSYFEITMRDFRRMHFCTGKIASQTYRIEALINAVATSDRDGWRL